MCVDWMRPILLLSVNLFSIDKVICNRAIVGSWKHWALWVLILLEVHGHRVTNSNSVWMIIHLENFLLLSCKVLVLTVSLIHHGKPHSPWHKYVLTSLIWWLDSSSGCHEVVLMRLCIWLLKWLEMMRWSILVGIVCNVSAAIGTSLWLSSKLCSWHTLLVMTVELLNVKASSSLIVAQGAVWAWFQGLVLSPRSSLSVEMLPQMAIWTLDVDASCILETNLLI